MSVPRPLTEPGAGLGFLAPWALGSGKSLAFETDAELGRVSGGTSLLHGTGPYIHTLLWKQLGSQTPRPSVPSSRRVRSGRGRDRQHSAHLKNLGALLLHVRPHPGSCFWTCCLSTNGGLGPGVGL